ncbi:unnamed protein product [Gongylonema pulchrum]|uniref:Uncharacterized protein n=1 Tax=Gongylonema pulchrum TaxID=637853 RepID=A0A183DVZ0_9BILA|nr:unnamed protein product [Gongylonema pulchrum]
MPDSHHSQSENPFDYAHPDNPSQASVSRQTGPLLQNPEKYQTQLQLLLRAKQPIYYPEPYLFSLQEYAAKRLPGSSDLRATQDYSESEEGEDDGYPENPTAQQLPEQSLRIHNSNLEIPALLESLIRGMLQWPLVTQTVLSQMPRQMADSGPVLVDLTNEETSDSDDNQQDSLEHRPRNFSALQVQRYAGHSLTENVALSRSQPRFSDQWAQRQAAALCRALVVQFKEITYQHFLVENAIEKLPAMSACYQSSYTRMPSPFTSCDTICQTDESGRMNISYDEASSGAKDDWRAS